jgi:hypothetical protein
MTRSFIYQDPIHNAIEFPGKDLNDPMRNLINAFEVQRLRHIRQNGLANLVFHGMEHSRFSHSLGVAYTARRMFDRIVQNDDIQLSKDEPTKLTTVAAALLHDVGHGPFSHTLEEILKDAGIDFHHEQMTLRIIEDESTAVHQALVAVDRQLPKQLVPYIDKHQRQDDHWSYKLVSSEMDADRLDYVLRDAHMAGLTGTRYDLERILRMLSRHPDQPWLLAVDRRGTEAVESFLLALDQLYRAVYFHKAVRAATVLLKSILKRAIDLYNDEPRDLFPRQLNDELHPLDLLFRKGMQVELQQYLRLGEGHVWAIIDRWREHADPILRDLSDRLIKRQLPKTIARPQVNELVAFKEQAESLVRQQLGVDGDQVKYYVTIDQPTRRTYKGGDAIWMIGRGRNAERLQDEEGSQIIEAVKNPRDYPRLIFPNELKGQLV